MLLDVVFAFGTLTALVGVLFDYCKPWRDRRWQKKHDPNQRAPK